MNPENVFSAYAEGFGLAVSATDAKILFMSIQPKVVDGVVSGQAVSENCRVTLSIPLAKQLCKQLSNAIEQYEKSYGKVIDLEEIKE